MVKKLPQSVININRNDDMALDEYEDDFLKYEFNENEKIP